MYEKEACLWFLHLSRPTLDLSCNCGFSIPFAMLKVPRKENYMLLC
jgi:hypothetical protein